MKKCPIHEKELVCLSCVAIERGRKGGLAKTEAKKASSRANLKKAYDPPPKEEATDAE